MMARTGSASHRTAEGNMKISLQEFVVVEVVFESHFRSLSTDFNDIIIGISCLCCKMRISRKESFAGCW